jgi:hypothetical protein
MKQLSPVGQASLWAGSAQRLQPVDEVCRSPLVGAGEKKRGQTALFSA